LSCSCSFVSCKQAAAVSAYKYWPDVIAAHHNPSVLYYSDLLLLTLAELIVLAKAKASSYILSFFEQEYKYE